MVMSERYSTEAAARFLKVSEASVRRWSDAGLLRSQRIGRRGTRRFAESDLRAFAEAGRGGHAPRGGGRKRRGTVEVRHPAVPIHRHPPTFFATDARPLPVSLPFLPGRPWRRP